MLRDIELIIKLRQNSNNSRVINNVRKSLSKLDSFAPKELNASFTSMTRRLGNLLRRIEDLSGSVIKLRNSFKSVEKIVISTRESIGGINPAVKKTSENINKLTEKSRKATKETGNLARENLEASNSFKGLNGSIQMVDKAIAEAEQGMSGLSSSINESMKFGTSLNTTAKELGMSFGIVHKATSLLDQSLKSLNTSQNQIKIGASSASKIFRNLKVPIDETIVALKGIETEFRVIQDLGKLTRKSSFDQDISILKMYRKEIVNLREELIRLTTGEISLKAGGLTKEMILGLREAKAEILDLKNKLELIEKIKSLSYLKDRFNDLSAVAKKTGVELGQFKEYISEVFNMKDLKDITVGPQLRKIINEYRKVFGEIKIIARESGIEIGKAITPAGLIAALKKLGIDGEKSFSLLESSVRKLQILYDESMIRMIQNTEMFAKSQFELRNKTDVSRVSLESQALVMNNLRSVLVSVSSEANELAASVKLFGDSFKSSNTAAERTENLLKKIAQAIQYLPPSMQAYLVSVEKWINSAFRSGLATKAFQNSITNLGKSVSIIREKITLLDGANKYLGNSEEILSRKLEYAREISQRYTNQIIILHESLEKLKKSSRSKNLGNLEQELIRLGHESTTAAIDVNRLNEELERLRRRSADLSRAMDRVTARGFASMIVSQAAWMAGFQVVFGTLDRFKEALNAVYETETAVTRAFRTQRSEIWSLKEIWDQLKKAAESARMETGRPIAEIGEILYQLGSAGLTTEETIAALDSTLNNIVATESEVAQITKLVAGLYWNFSDQIVKIDGKVTSLNDSQLKNMDIMRESVTLYEKFQYINDLLVRTYEETQAEMLEIRDGLKFMAQSAKLANLTLAQQMGILSTLNDHLVKAGHAGRGMRVILNKLSKEAHLFEKAFNIEIDTTKPMDFIKIMEDIKKKTPQGAASIDYLGKAFKRLGLRGSEPFLVLIKHFNEMNMRIKDLQTNATNTASRIKNIRLSDFASQAEIAKAKIEGLLKTGLEPLAGALKIIIGILNITTGEIKNFDSQTGGLGAKIVKITGSIITMGIAFMALTKTKAAFSWIKGVVVNLGDLFSRLGKTTENASRVIGETTKKLGFFGTISKTYSDQMVVHSKAVGGGYSRLTAATFRLSAATKALGVAFATLGTIFKMVAIGAIITGIVMLIEHFWTLKERLKAQASQFQKNAAMQEKYIDVLERYRMNLVKIQDTEKADINMLKELALELGTNIDKYRTKKEAIENLTQAIQYNINKEKELKKLMQEQYILKNLESITASLGRSWSKLWMDIKDHFDLASVNDFRDGIVELSEKNKVLEASLKLLNSQLQNETNLNSNVAEAIRDTVTQVKNQISANLLEIEELKERLKLQEQNRESQRLYRETAKSVLEIQDAQNKRTSESIFKLEKYSEVLVNAIFSLEKIKLTMSGVMAKFDEFSSSYKNMEALLIDESAIDNSAKKLEYLGTSLKSILLTSQELGRNQEISKFMLNAAIATESAESAITSASIAESEYLKILSSAKFSELKKEEIDKKRMEATKIYTESLKNLNTIVNQGDKMIGSYTNEIIKLWEQVKKNPINELTASMKENVQTSAEIKNENGELISGVKNLSSGFGDLGNRAGMVNKILSEMSSVSAPQLKDELVELNRNIEILSVGYERITSKLSSIISASSSYETNNKKLRESVVSQKMAIIDLKKAYEIANSGSKERKNLDKDIAANKKILIILEERHARAVEKTSEEVGNSLINMKEMKNATEELRQKIEDLRIEEIKSESERSKHKYGSKEYREMDKTLDALRQKRSLASKELEFQMSKEEENARRIKDETWKATVNVRQQVRDLINVNGVLEDRVKRESQTTKILEEQANKAKERIPFLEEELASLEKQKGYTEKQLENIESMRKKELNLANLKKEAGQLTEKDYQRQMQLIMILTMLRPEKPRKP